MKDNLTTKVSDEAESPSFLVGAVSGSVCPLCGSVNYEEHEELMYKKGIDDPQYGGGLINVKISDCRDCG